MASSSGNSSGSGGTTTTFVNSGSEGDLQSLMDQRKRKRMESNRESARRSRQRKQKHLDDLKARLAELQNENSHFLRSIALTTQNYVAVEAENSVLRSQMAELTQTLHYLNGILNHSAVTATAVSPFNSFQHLGFCDGLLWSSSAVANSQQFPIMATPEMMFDY